MRAFILNTDCNQKLGIILGNTPEEAAKKIGCNNGVVAFKDWKKEEWSAHPTKGIIGIWDIKCPHIIDKLCDCGHRYYIQELPILNGMEEDIYQAECPKIHCLPQQS